MAYKTEDLMKKALEIANNPDVYFISDIIAFLPCSKSSFYDHFPENSDLLDDIKEKLTDNKVNTKVKLRKRLAEGEKAAEILALYKLIGTQEERRALSQNYTDHTTGGDKMKSEKVIVKFS